MAGLAHRYQVRYHLAAPSLAVAFAFTLANSASLVFSHENVAACRAAARLITRPRGPAHNRSR
ncbi:hypothetical protein J113_03455 [Mycobacterium tuberculosis CAS/NITR204]|uniref:Uncharacterized protein n=1 Tax=Mycobacterium tuberculosis CAS/NITR204 TaxID=1310114 RepID=R4MA36_MYCTX|nr:hypothetical protein J113_03455 [Mycobacterium tuberculosis CAS/NITR204]